MGRSTPPPPKAPPCTRPPAGWVCSRDRHHVGPCAARKAYDDTPTRTPWWEPPETPSAQTDRMAADGEFRFDASVWDSTPREGYEARRRRDAARRSEGMTIIELPDPDRRLHAASRADSVDLPWARGLQRRCRARREARGRSPYTGRCGLVHDHTGDHALGLGLDWPRWSTDFTG